MIASRSDSRAWMAVIEDAAGPPEGWSGKLWPLEQGLRAGIAQGAPFLLFTDADIAHLADSLKKLVNVALGHDLNLVFLMATLKAGTFWARLLLVNSSGAVTSMGVLATGLAAWGLMYRTYLPMNKWYGQPQRFALALPLSALLFTLMPLDSAWCFCRKRGGSWKGRTHRSQ